MRVALDQRRHHARVSLGQGACADHKVRAVVLRLVAAGALGARLVAEAELVLVHQQHGLAPLLMTAHTVGVSVPLSGPRGQGAHLVQEEGTLIEAEDE